MRALLFFSILFSLCYLSGCGGGDSVQNEETEVKEEYVLNFSVNGLDGQLEVTNGREFKVISEDGVFSFSEPMLIGDSFNIEITSTPENQVCSVNPSGGSYLDFVDFGIVIKCRSDRLLINIGENEGVDKSLSLDASKMPDEYLKSFIFDDYDFVTYKGTATESVSTVAGAFLSIDDKKHYFGVTRSGSHGRLFQYDIDSNVVVDVFDIKGAEGAWSLKEHNNKLYIGTYNPASLYEYDLSSKKLELVVTLENEQYIWDMDFYNGGVLLGTYPSASLYLINIESKGVTNLGKMSERDDTRYIRSLSVMNDDVYVGGGAQAELFKFSFIDGESELISFPEGIDDSFVYQLYSNSDLLFIGLSPSTDVLVYSVSKGEFLYHFEDITTQSVHKPDFSDDKLHFELRGYLLEYDLVKNTLKRVSEDSGVATHFIEHENIGFVNENGLYIEASYEGGALKTVDFLTSGLSGLPATPYSVYAKDCKLFLGERRLKVIDERTETSSFSIISGEPKAMTVSNGMLYSANYTGAQLWSYPLSLFYNGESKNLSDLSYLTLSIGNEQNRPLSMDSNNYGIVVGSEPHYGDYGGAFSFISPNGSDVRVYRNIVEKHSVSAVKFERSVQSNVFVGTSNSGGTGSTPVNSAPYLVKWDLKNDKEIFRVQPDLKSNKIIKINSLIGDNFVLIHTDLGFLSLIDKNNGGLVKTSDLYLRDFAVTSSGSVFGVGVDRVYVINPANLDAEVLIEGFEDIRFIVDDSESLGLYIIDGNQLYSLGLSSNACR